ncbi:MAG TPA: aminotransferase class IV [Saprospiraceae bacterium]|nr:aminotransferase class IV [Saprospiraceae bacterium]HMQ83624.1 aminotransferase class IV [Saprospiraceae bacterium]
MVKYCSINGQLWEYDKASLHVSDLSILRGYGIFDFFRVVGGQPVCLEDYLQRFFRSAALLGLNVPLDRADMESAVFQVIAANHLEEAAIRLVLTGGLAEDSYTPTEPNLLILPNAFIPAPGPQYQRGVSLMTYPHQRECPEAKTINYLTGIRMQPILKAKGFDYLLYHDGDAVRESDRANFFIVTPEHKLVTPNQKILLGITRKRILGIATDRMAIEERDIHLSELLTCKEAFLSGSNKGILPVCQIDDHKIGTGAPGVSTLQLMEALEQEIPAY